MDRQRKGDRRFAVPDRGDGKKNRRETLPTAGDREKKHGQFGISPWGGAELKRCKQLGKCGAGSTAGRGCV